MSLSGCCSRQAASRHLLRAGYGSSTGAEAVCFRHNGIAWIGGKDATTEASEEGMATRVPRHFGVNARIVDPGSATAGLSGAGTLV